MSVDGSAEQGGRDRSVAARRKGPRLVALFLAGALMFNYPLLALFDRAATAFGIPVLYVYIFGAWALLIALLALVAERKG